MRLRNATASAGRLSLPDSVKTVGEWAFYLCKGFTGLKLSAGLTKIEERSFAHMYGLRTEVVIPEGVTEIGESAFSCSYMPSVRLPSTLKKIEKQAFMYAHNLTKITLPDGLETIGDEAFSGCHLKNAVVLPASIKSIGKKAFDRIGRFTEISMRSLLARISSAMRPRLSGRGMPTARSRRTGRSFTCPARPAGRAIPTRATRSPRGTAKRAGTTRTQGGSAADINGNQIETSWSVNPDTGKITLTDDLNEGCVVAVSYDAEGRVTGIGVLRTKTDFVILNLQDTCRLFLLNASSAPRLNTPVTINDYLPV